MGPGRGAGWVTFGTGGTGVRHFNSPPQVRIGSDGRIYIADQNNNRVVRINDMTGAGWITFPAPNGEPNLGPVGGLFVR